MRKSFVAALAASVLGLSVAAHAAETAPEPPEVDWSFDGIFGTYDRAAVQRGLQVYKEVCSACHSLTQVHYRNLTDLGYSADQVKQFAAGFEVQNEEPNDQGERSEEHTSELQSLMRISYAVFCLKKKIIHNT